MLSISFYDGIKYHRSDFMNRDSDFFGNGVKKLTDFPYTLPTPNNMNINIGTGVAWVDGFRIANDSTAITLTVQAADATNPRIDIVQIGHDDINSQAVLSIKKGVASSTPVEPDADPSYVKLFAINVPANATVISAGNITDRRALVPLNVSGTQISFGGAYQKPVNGIPKTDLESAVQSSLGKADSALQSVPSASTSQAGIVGLTDSVASTSTTTAATPNSVKTVNDAVLSHEADYVKHPGFGITTNSGNAYSVTLNPVPTGYVDGMGVKIKVNADSTGVSTLNVNNLGAKPLKSSTGNDVTTLKANGIYTFIYNADTGNFILQGEGVDASNLIASVNNILGS